GLVLAGTNGVPRGLVESQGVLYGPGIGIAYALDSKTVIRAGGRIAYDRVQGNPWYTNLSIPPTTRQGNIYFGNLSTLQTMGATYGIPAPGNNGAGLAPDGHIPTTYSWNFGVQRQLPFHTVLEASYVGNINRHLLELVNINMPAWGTMWDAANV